jgi:transcriptional regulator with XRE-family HTH domain
MTVSTRRHSKLLARERGKRLRQYREQTGLARAYFEENFGISQSSIRAWEMGINTLSEKKARMFTEIFRSLGLDLEAEDLIHGSDYMQAFTSGHLRHASFKDELFLDQEAQIYLEIDYFKKNVKNYALLKVHDQTMGPFFIEGDMVGGVKSIFTPKLVGKFCIIETTQGVKKLRKVLDIKSESTFLFGLTNVAENLNEPPLEEIPVVSIAPITRLWRISSCIT